MPGSRNHLAKIRPTFTFKFLISMNKFPIAVINAIFLEHIISIPVVFYL